MFKTGDYIIYGSNGVCQVMNVGRLDAPEISKDRIYYTLQQKYVKESKIYTPADNQKIIMRPVITKKEAMELIGKIKDIDSLWIPDEKKREQEYKDSLKKCDIKELVKIIKTIYDRKQSRRAEGKKVTAVDQKYFHMAEECLYGEIGAALGMEKEEAKEFVTGQVKQLAEEEE